MNHAKGTCGVALRGIVRLGTWLGAASAIAIAAPVFGQGTAAAPEAATSADGEGLAEIVVTARRRNESLQETPVSVSVVTADTARELNLRSFQDLRGVVTNLEVVPLNNGGTSITIRGVGQTSAQANVDAKAGFYVDEMYVARQEGNSLYFYDIQSLQVLKGPQGTLFGKNTTGGALLLTTARPEPEFGGYVQARVGSYERFDTEGAINIPLGEKLLTRLSFRTQSADGYLDHVIDDERSNTVNDKSVRFQVRALPTDRLTIDLLGEYNQSNTDGLSTVVTQCKRDDYSIGFYDLTHSVPYCDAYPILGGKRLIYGGATLSIPTSSLLTDLYTGGDYNNGISRGGKRGPFADTEVKTFNARVQYELTDELALKSITAWRNSDSASYNPTQNAPNELYGEINDTDTQQFSQELNLTGSLLQDRLNFVFGLFYSNQNTQVVQDTGPDYFDPVGYVYDAKSRYKSWAAYLQASYKFGGGVELTVGGRYTRDKKTAQSSLFNWTNFADPCATWLDAFLTGQAVCGGYFRGSGSDSWSSFDPRAQISWQPSRDLFLYASVTRGYNAGGFNQQLGSDVGPGNLLSYDPEKLISYEAGIKSEWFDRRLRANLSVFYQKYKDIQTTVTVELNGIPTRQVQTGASAHEQGFEAELVFQPIEALTLRADVGYVDQQYDSVRESAGFTVDTPVSSAPKWTYSLAGNYRLDLGSAGLVNTSVNWRWVDRKPTCVPVGTCYLPAYGVLGVRLDYQLSEDSPWQFSLYGTNLNNSLQRFAIFDFALRSYTPGRPREIGIEVLRRF